MPRPSSASATRAACSCPGRSTTTVPRSGRARPGCAATTWCCCRASTPSRRSPTIERHGVDVVYLVPTMMKRILRLADDVRLGYDLSSLRIVWHLAEPCPPWLKEAWIDWLGPERIFELYAGTEAQAVTIITGAEWLEHRGSVGRVSTGEMKICDDDGNELPAGEQGEVWMRSYPRRTDLPLRRRRGADARRRLGVARRHRLVRRRRLPLPRRPGAGHDPVRRREHLPGRGRGGDPRAPGRAFVCRDRPARRRPRQRRPRHRRGRRIGDPGRPSCSTFLGERLTRYKLPRTFEFVDEPLRDDAGKVRRTELRAARL